jgi:hypothetical protein
MMTIQENEHTKNSIVAVRMSTGSLVLVIQEEAIPGFHKLINRAMNTWADAPPELKALADIIVEGKVLQDYQSQDSRKSKPRPD